MKKLVVILSVALCACSNAVDGWRLIAANEICAQRGGVDHVQNFFGQRVICRDGFMSELSRPIK